MSGAVDGTLQYAGSRNPDGNVPNVNLNDDGDVYVNDWNPSTASDALSTREEVRILRLKLEPQYCWRWAHNICANHLPCVKFLALFFQA